MNKHNPEQKPSRAESTGKTWWDYIGPIYRYNDLPDEAKADEGLIVVTTTDKVRYVPVRQFDPTTLTEKGAPAPKVDYWVGLLWRVAKEFEIRQLGFSEWTTAVSVLSPLQGQELSFVERLYACTDDEERKRIIMEYVTRSISGATWNDIKLILPDEGRQIEGKE